MNQLLTPESPKTSLSARRGAIESLRCPMLTPRQPPLTNLARPIPRHSLNPPKLAPRTLAPTVYPSQHIPPMLLSSTATRPGQPSRPSTRMMTQMSTLTSASMMNSSRSGRSCPMPRQRRRRPSPRRLLCPRIRRMTIRTTSTLMTRTTTLTSPRRTSLRHRMRMSRWARIPRIKIPKRVKRTTTNQAHYLWVGEVREAVVVQERRYGGMVSFIACTLQSAIKSSRKNLTGTRHCFLHCLQGGKGFSFLTR